MRIGCVCANKNLVDSPKFDAQPNLKVLSSISDRLVFPGTIPTFAARNKALRAAGSDIFIGGKDPREVIPAVVEQLTNDAEKNGITFKSVENQYAYYDELSEGIK